MSEVAVHIGELSKRTGVSRRSLRYYEKRGMLRARRSEAGWRQYDEGITPGADRATFHLPTMPESATLRKLDEYAAQITQL